MWFAGAALFVRRNGSCTAHCQEGVKPGLTPTPAIREPGHTQTQRCMEQGHSGGKIIVGLRMPTRIRQQDTAGEERVSLRFSRRLLFYQRNTQPPAASDSGSAFAIKSTKVRTLVESKRL